MSTIGLSGYSAGSSLFEADLTVVPSPVTHTPTPDPIESPNDPTLYGTITKIVLDRVVVLDPARNYIFSIITPTYTIDPAQGNIDSTEETKHIRKSSIQKRTFPGTNVTTDGTYSTITLPLGLDNQNFRLVDNAVWCIELETETTAYSDIISFPTTNYDYYRVIKIEEKDEAHYNVIGLQYSAQKFNEIEKGLEYGRTDVVINTPPVMPQGLTLTLNKN